MPNPNTMSRTELAAGIPEVWAGQTLEYLGEYLNLLRTVTLDMDFDEINTAGDKVNITVDGTFVANDKAAQTDVTVQKPADSKLTVTLDKHKEITFAPEDVARAMRKPETIQSKLRQAALVLAESVEHTVADHYTDAGHTLDAKGDTGDNLRAKLAQARTKLVNAKVPVNSPMHAYAAAEHVENLGLMDDTSKVGSSRPFTEGSIGRIKGFDHFETQAVRTSGSPATFHNLYYAPTAIVFVPRRLPMDAEQFGGARQGIMTDPRTGLSIRVTMSYQHKALAPMVTVDALWGSSILRADHLVDLQTS